MPKRRKNRANQQHSDTIQQSVHRFSEMGKKQRVSMLSEADKEELDVLFGKRFKYSSHTSRADISRGDSNPPQLEDYLFCQGKV